MNEQSESSQDMIRIDQLPKELQEKIRQHQEEQRQIELYQKFQELMNSTSNKPNITINNHNTYYITNDIRVFKNQGIINEKEESAMDWLARTVGRAAGKEYAKWKNNK